MQASWGELIYWTATVIAGADRDFRCMGYVQNTDEGYPVIPVAPLLFAGAIWLAGRACRRWFA